MRTTPGPPFASVVHAAGVRRPRIVAYVVRQSKRSSGVGWRVARTGVFLSYCFRVRFRLGRTRIQSEALELGLAEEGGGRIFLRATSEATPLSDADQIALRGEGYATREDAQETAERWVPRLQVAFARLRLGADFGLRSPGGMVTEHGLSMFEEMAGQRVLADAPGVLVFECDPQPRFVSIGATAVVGKPAERFLRFVDAATDRDIALGEREQLAYDLYSASFFETSSDARFLLLMMAAETLIEQEYRPEDVRAHVSRLITETRSSGLSPDHIESLVASLEGLSIESVGRAGRRLAASLGDRRYMEESASTFFMRCYEMRSQLVHGHFPRPAPGDVGIRAANLEGFVGDLLGVALLDVAD
jgi:hypothetical protein